jgi:hypothetical protein
MLFPRSPDYTLPKFRCDFNEHRLIPDCNGCVCYAVDQAKVKVLEPKWGMQILLWDWHDSKNPKSGLYGVEAQLEPLNDVWIARPLPNTNCEGLPDDTFVA